MWLSVGIRGSVTRSRSVAQEVVSTTKELSSWGKWDRRQTEDELLSLMRFVFEFRYVPRRNEGRHDYYFFFLQEASKAEKNQSREISWQPKVYARDFKLLFYPHWTKGDVICCMIITLFFWDEICLPSNKWSKSERGMFIPSNKSPAHFMMSPTLRSGRKIRYSNTPKYTRAQKEFEGYSCVKQSLNLYAYQFWPGCSSAYWGSEPPSLPFGGQIYKSISDI